MEDVLEVSPRILGVLGRDQQATGAGDPATPPGRAPWPTITPRNGVSNLFMLFAPLEGWRRVEVTDRRTRTDWAEVVRKLVDEDYPNKVVLVMDNLNTHHPASLYAAFEPAEARRIAQRLEIHYTPKHGSWLNIAEIELGVPQCLDLPRQEDLARETGAWPTKPGGNSVDWPSPPRTPASSSSLSTRQYGGLLAPPVPWPPQSIPLWTNAPRPPSPIPSGWSRPGQSTRSKPAPPVWQCCA